jgi:hypothetical protein
MSLTQDLLHDLFEYDPITGFLYWRVKTCKKVVVGARAGNYCPINGYVRIGVDGINRAAHHIVWIMHYGYQPDEIDHINHIRDDNRLENLREVSRQENTQNSSRRSDNNSGVTGVGWVKSRQKWTARIQDSHIGIFDDWFDAVCARKAAEVSLGFHANHGNLTH